MPIYEYKCQKCGHKFEKLVFKKEEIRCPKCQSNILEKIFSTFNSGKKSDNSSDCDNGACGLDCPSCGN